MAWCVCLLAGASFYLFYPGYLSFYTLLLILILPLLSLLFTLVQRRRCHLTLSPSAAVATRQEEVFLRLLVRTPDGQGRDKLTLTYRVEHLLHPQQTRRERVTLSPGQGLILELPSHTCGWVRVTPLRCVLPDWLGLFSLSIPLPKPALVLVLPQIRPLPPHLDFSPRPGEPLRPRPGGGPGEDYELRPYRPGDPVNSIHWKLTAKQPNQDPVLRETLEPVHAHLAVTYDHFGPTDRLEGVLDLLFSLGHSLVGLERPFTLCWADPVSGAPSYYEVDCPAAWDRCLRVLLGRSAPAEGVSFPSGQTALPGHSGPIRWIRLEPEEVTGP